MPLLNDIERRRQLEVYHRGRFYHQIEPLYDQQLVEQQFQFEIRLESELRKEGYTDDSINASRQDWRRIGFTQPKTGRFLIKRKMSQMLRENNIKDTGAYKRIIKAIGQGSIHLKKQNSG